jgi:hypothetical protein
MYGHINSMHLHLQRFQIPVKGAEELLKTMRSLFTEVELISEENLNTYNNVTIADLVNKPDIVTADVRDYILM